MKYYDQHVHSSFSFDSRTELADYLPYANDTFVTCEHVDLENSANDFRDSWMDYKAYCAYLQQLQEKTDIQLLKGVKSAGFLHIMSGLNTGCRINSLTSSCSASTKTGSLIIWMRRRSSTMQQSCCTVIFNRCWKGYKAIFLLMSSVILTM